MATMIASCALALAIAGANDTPQPDPNVGRTLSEVMEPAFVAEFPDTESARKAWQVRGGETLIQIGYDFFPVPDAAAFKERALAALRAKRSAEPNASMSDLVDAALAGSGDTPDTGITILTLPEESPTEAPQAAALRSVKGVNVLRISTFGESTVKEIEQAITGLKGRLVIDLRGNQGGLWTEIIRAAELFIGGDRKTIATLRARTEQRPYRTASPGIEHNTNLEIVVLIDQKTESGALVFAAALADHRRAGIAGVAVNRPNGLMFVVSFLRSSQPHKPVFVKYPIGQILRANGAPMSEGLKVDVPVAAQGDAAIEEAAKAFTNR